MVAVTTIISLLPVFMVEYQEVKLINELNSFFNFDHNIFLIDSSVDLNCYVSREEVTSRSLYLFKSVDENIAGLESLTNITSKNAFMIVVPGSPTFDHNFNLLKRINKTLLFNKYNFK